MKINPTHKLILELQSNGNYSELVAFVMGVISVATGLAFLGTFNCVFLAYLLNFIFSATNL